MNLNVIELYFITFFAIAKHVGITLKSEYRLPNYTFVNLSGKCNTMETAVKLYSTSEG